MSSATPRLPRQQRLAQLLDVTEDLFITHGYAAVSIEDISRAAGITRPIVYRHFSSKEGAYIACVERARDDYERRLLERVDLSHAPREQLTAGAEAFFEMIEDDPGRWRLLFGSNAVLPGQYDRRLADLRFRTIEQIEVLLRAAAPSAPRQRIEAAAHAVSGAFERLGHWWLRHRDIPRADVVGHGVDILWSGLRPYVEAE
jgi:AcrR family transcriptional regulator